MRTLSHALRHQPSIADPFEAAFVALALRLPVMSAEGRAETKVRELHAAWPMLGGSVRLLGTMAKALEVGKMLPAIRPYQPVYRQAIHRSLWSVIAEMHGCGHTNEQIADFLECHAL